ARALVVVRGSGTAQIVVAYVVPKRAVEAAALREHARKRLPDFMVPADIVLLEAFPLTPNGKVDKRRLPAPRREGTEDGAAFVAPRTPAEQVLAGIWGGLLERQPIGAHDDFFQLGGHSLLAAQVMSRVRKAFGVDVPLSAIFDHPTPEDLGRTGAPPLERRLMEESARPFPLATGPVVRAHLFQVADAERVLLIVMHHIVSDGWSIGILMRELSALYAAEVRGEELRLPP